MSRQEIALNPCSRCSLRIPSGEVIALGGRIYCAPCALAVIITLQVSGRLEIERACGRCNRTLDPKLDAERCWYCMAALCAECSEAEGHCGHQEARALNRRLSRADSRAKRGT